MGQQNGKSQHVTVEAVPAPAATKCAHCSQTFPLSVPIVGAPKDAEFFQTCGAIAQHLMKVHKDIAGSVLQRQAQFGFALSGLLTLEHVESNDAGLSKWRDQSRHQLHNFSTKNRISDATIETKVTEMDLSHYFDMDADRSSDIKELFIMFLKAQRDILEERGVYPLEATQVISAR